MLGALIGALIGERIDRQDGEGGAAGAAIGAASVAVLKRVIPIALLGGGILVAKHYIDKARTAPG